MKENHVERIGIVAAIVFAAFLSACATMEGSEQELSTGKTAGSAADLLKGGSVDASSVGSYSGNWSYNGLGAGAVVQILSVEGTQVKASYNIFFPATSTGCLNKKYTVDGEIRGGEIVLLPPPGDDCGRIFYLTRTASGLVGTFSSHYGGFAKIRVTR